MLRSTKKVKISIKKNKTTCTFKSVERENEGTYTCKATSESGTVETKATLFCHELSEEERTKLEERKQKEERKKRKDQERRAAAEAAKENARMLAKKAVEDAEKERKRKQEERKMLEQRKKEERILEEKKREEERLATQQLKLKKTPTAKKVVEVTKEETDEFVKTKHVLKKTQEIQQKEIGTMSLEKVQLKKVHAEETETEEFGKASQIEVHVKGGTNS